MIKGNAIVGQSGGPTSAINATLSGVIRGVSENTNINKLYGMRYGIEGLIDENIVELNYLFGDEEALRTLEATPAAALGSCRKRLKNQKDDPETYQKLLEIFKKHDIRYFFYIGGNDSMDTVSKLSEYMNASGYEMYVIGVPKTIDNDLMCTDHTPGFGSAAKFVATTVKEFMRDVAVYTVKAVTIVEIMGRDAGWLTASAALPCLDGDGPDLVYLPEAVFNQDSFINDINNALKKHPNVLVAVSEGIRFENSEYVGAGLQSGAVDVFGHKYLSGTAKVLEGLVKEKIGCKVRSVELSLTQRSAAHILSKTDIDESVLIGRSAVEAAACGKSGVMMIYVREEGEKYSVKISSEDISKIANGIREVPKEFINKSGNGVTDECLEYLAPLIIGEVYPKYENGMPKHLLI